MYSFSASAPGKVFLSGEYAILEGAKSVVFSVDKRIEATTTNLNITQSNLIVQVKKHAAKYFLKRTGRDAGAIPNIDIESSGFSIKRKKIGIGSSAAVAAATAGALFLWFGLSIEECKSEILKVAMDAHREYQDGKGSGADVAASVMGGAIVFEKGENPCGAPDNSLINIFVWTGESASTVSLVEKVKELKSEKQEVYEEIMTPMIFTANQLAEAYLERDENKIVTLTSQYGGYMEALGVASGISIITEQIKKVQSIAESCNGAAKPSGAGGGDLAVAIFKNRTDGDSFLDICRKNSIIVVDINKEHEGLIRL
ncbi:MAG: hypothetical protein JXR91_16410 [Deltaproteobacteria bacterium]|nr:hypothetical protein [Deltaproteobacteria bacterium]